MSLFFYTVTYSFDADHFMVGPFLTEEEAWHLMEADARNEYRIDAKENILADPILTIKRDENTIELTHGHISQVSCDMATTTWTLFSEIRAPKEVRSHLDRVPKLRLLLFEECDRKCDGCCNNDWNLATLPVCNDYTPYRLIMLTGGEPMLHPDIIKQAVNDIRAQTDAPIYLYTAHPEGLEEIMPILDGVTITIHESADILRFRQFLARTPRLEGKSLRLNVFQDAGEVQAEGWHIKSGIRWIKNCPLPQGEVLMKYRY